VGRSRNSSAPARAPRSSARRSRYEHLSITVEALAPLPEVRAGDDLASLLVAAATTPFRPGDLVVVAHKVVSKAEARVRRLDGIAPSEEALTLASAQGKDARVVQAVLDESVRVVRAARGVIVCETRHGFVCANAGVDASNATEPGEVVLLPLDPDASARALRARLPARPAVIVSDSFGRPWRVGQTDVAVGAAGVVPVDDWRGRTDAAGHELRATAIAVADSIAAAADLARAKDSRQPAILIRGLERFVTADDGPGARALRRDAASDLFR
jgi:coenzyme F420-0:L-glutamate ligase/coenzyme F420-1:gamma-L-glutamate ligase